MNNAIRCQICDSINTDKHKLIMGIKYSCGKFYQIIHCRNCGHFFLDVQMENDFIKKYYPANYSPHNPNNFQFNTAREHVMQLFRSYVFGKRHNNRSTCKNFLQSFLSYFYNKTAYRSIPDNINNGKLLDIGCGVGSYLQIMQKIGWDVYGVETNKSAVDFTRTMGLNVIHSKFEDVEYPEKYFDAITFWHVLEHFPNPKNILIKARRLLKDDGILLIGIPNYDSLDRKIFGAYWNGYEVPLHLHHFTPDSIKVLIKLAGFSLKKNYIIRPSDMTSSINNYLNFHCGKTTMRLLKNILFVLTIPITCLFSILKKSSIIVLYAKKI